MGVGMHVEFGACDVLFGTFAEVEVDFIAESDGCDGVVKDDFGNADVSERTDCHVAADAGETIEIENSHGWHINCSSRGRENKKR